MTTITIDNIPETWIKTRFTSPLEAGYYLIGLSMKSSWIAQKKSKRNIAMNEYSKGKSVDGEVFLKELIASKIK